MKAANDVLLGCEVVLILAGRALERTSESALPCLESVVDRRLILGREEVLNDVEVGGGDLSRKGFTMDDDLVGLGRRAGMELRMVSGALRIE